MLTFNDVLSKVRLCIANSCGSFNQPVILDSWYKTYGGCVFIYKTDVYNKKEAPKSIKIFLNEEESAIWSEDIEKFESEEK